MRTRFKLGKFDTPVGVLNGDVFSLHLSSDYVDKSGAVQTKLQTISESIKHTQTISHWAMFYMPGVGFGGCFGNDSLPTRIRDMFPDGYEVAEGESVFIEQ